MTAHDDGELYDRLVAEGHTATEAQRIIEAQAIPDVDLWTFLHQVEDPTAHDWRIEGVFEAGDRFALTGGEGGGKSTFVGQIGFQASIGVHPFTLAEMEPLSVLYVDCENSAAQVRRKMEWFAGVAGRDSARRARFYPYVPEQGIDVANLETLSDLCRRVEQNKVDLVCIGPLWKIIGGVDPKDERAMASVTNALDRLRGVNGSVMVIEAHSPHANEHGRAKRPLGSSVMTRWPEFGYWLDRSGKLVPWRQPREQRAIPSALVRGGVWPWTASEVEGTEATDERASALVAAVVAVVAEHGELPLRHIEAKVPGGRALVRAAIEEALTAGLLSERPGPRRARMISDCATVPGLCPSVPVAQ